jgi:hypothetical protein
VTGVDEDGTLELPDGAIIFSLEFEDEGADGYGRHPAIAWVELPADGAT